MEGSIAKYSMEHLLKSKYGVTIQERVLYLDPDSSHPYEYQVMASKGELRAKASGALKNPNDRKEYTAVRAGCISRVVETLCK